VVPATPVYEFDKLTSAASDGEKVLALPGDCRVGASTRASLRRWWRGDGKGRAALPSSALPTRRYRAAPLDDSFRRGASGYAQITLTVILDVENWLK
jgi:hypothetical protein